MHGQPPTNGIMYAIPCTIDPLRHSFAHHQLSFPRSHPRQMVPFQLVIGRTQLGQTQELLHRIDPIQSAQGPETPIIKYPGIPQNTRTYCLQLYAPYIPLPPCDPSDCSLSLKESIVPYANQNVSSAHLTGSAAAVNFSTQARSVIPRAPVCT